MLSNKTSHDIFSYLTLEEKIEFMTWLTSEERKYNKQYKESLTLKPYRWVYLLTRAKKVEEIEDKEAKELQKIGKDIKEEELELESAEKIQTYHTLMKKLSKLDEEEEQFNIFKVATEMIIEREEYEHYKADEDEDRILIEGEDDDEGEGEGDDEEESDDENADFPSVDEFCEYAEQGKLKKIQRAMGHKEFIDLNLIKGCEKQVMIGEEEYNTELWNPMVFAINANQLKVVEYFLNEPKVNVRLALMNPDKMDVKYDELNDFFEITPLDELQNLLISIQNNHLKMFELLWTNNHAVWTEEHLIELLNHLIESEWTEGLVSFMESKTTREIFISLKLAERTKLFDSLIEIVEETENEEIQSYLRAALTLSPFSLGMVLSKFEDEDDQELVEKAKGNLKEPEYNYIIFQGEVEKFCEILSKNKHRDLADDLKRYQNFMQIHYKISINNAGVQALNPESKNIDLFKKEPKYAHINLHSIELSEKNNVVFPHIKDKKAIAIFGKNWDLLSLSLQSKNIDLFNTIIKEYKPLTSMLYRPKEYTDVEKKQEFASELQGLIQYNKEIDTLFNACENHPSLFTFQEVYLIIKNVLTYGKGIHMKVLNSKAVKSWFCFSNDESREKVS